MPAELLYLVPTDRVDPRDAIELATHAEARGFTGVALGDRFQPWLPAHGEAPHAWSLAGAIGARTNGTLSVSAVAGYRTHPAAVAQASATLAALYPGRHRLVLTPGSAIDEHVVGGYWPETPERIARMFDAAEVIRKLTASGQRRKDVRHNGSHFRMESARLWTAPAVAQPIMVAANGPLTARRAARFADGVLVNAAPTAKLTAIIQALREGARESGRDPGSIRLAVHVQLAWGRSDDEALDTALRVWPMPGLRFPRGDIRSPFDIEALAHAVDPDHLRERVTVSADPAVHGAELRRLRDLGFDSIQVHGIANDQREWLDAFATEIEGVLR